jgi:hypothetical protein
MAGCKGLDRDDDDDDGDGEEEEEEEEEGRGIQVRSTIRDSSWFHLLHESSFVLVLELEVELEVGFDVSPSPDPVVPSPPASSLLTSRLDRRDGRRSSGDLPVKTIPKVPHVVALEPAERSTRRSDPSARPEFVFRPCPSSSPDEEEYRARI